MEKFFIKDITFDTINQLRFFTVFPEQPQARTLAVAESDLDIIDFEYLHLLLVSR